MDYKTTLKQNGNNITKELKSPSEETVNFLLNFAKSYIVEQKDNLTCDFILN